MITAQAPITIGPLQRNRNNGQTGLFQPKENDPSAIALFVFASMSAYLLILSCLTSDKALFRLKGYFLLEVLNGYKKNFCR